MEKSFFLNSKGNWRGESQRATLWWFFVIFSAYEGCLLGASLGNPLLGAILGTVLGLYAGQVLHHLVCQTLLSEQIKPVKTKPSVKKSINSLYKQAKAATQELCNGGDLHDALDVAQDVKEDLLDEHRSAVIFYKGPKLQREKVMRETNDFYKHLKHKKHL